MKDFIRAEVPLGDGCCSWSQHVEYYFDENKENLYIQLGAKGGDIAVKCINLEMVKYIKLSIPEVIEINVDSVCNEYWRTFNIFPYIGSHGPTEFDRSLMNNFVKEFTKKVVNFLMLNLKIT